MARNETGERCFLVTAAHVLDMASPRLAHLVVADLDALLEALATRQSRITPT